MVWIVVAAAAAVMLRCIEVLEIEVMRWHVGVGGFGKEKEVLLTSRKGRIGEHASLRCAMCGI